MDPVNFRITEQLSTFFRVAKFETSGKHYKLIDGESHVDLIKAIIGGLPEIQAAILVVSINEGITKEITEQIQLANKIGIRTIFPFLNEVDIADPELIGMCQDETEELLTKYGYTGEKKPLTIIGNIASALKYKGKDLGATDWQPIVDLIFSLAQHTPIPILSSKLPLIAPISTTSPLFNLVFEAVSIVTTMLDFALSSEERSEIGINVSSVILEDELATGFPAY